MPYLIWMYEKQTHTHQVNIHNLAKEIKKSNPLSMYSLSSNYFYYNIQVTKYLVLVDDTAHNILLMLTNDKVGSCSFPPTYPYFRNIPTTIFELEHASCYDSYKLQLIWITSLKKLSLFISSFRNFPFLPFLPHVFFTIH